MFWNIDYAGPSIDPTWEEELNRIAPETPYGHDHLRIWWEPGDPWAVVERFVVWQLTPVWRVPDLGIREALDGPNPRAFGYYDQVLGRFVRKRYLPISFQQWRLYRETGYYAQPLWVVQGRNAGHLRRWTEVQSTISQMNGGPPEPPVPGELPYAPFDMRVVEKLKYLDALQKYGDILEHLSSKPRLAERLERRERETVTSMAEQMWNWLGSQIGGALDGDDGITRKEAQLLWDHAERDVPPEDPDEIHETFVTGVASNYN